MGNLYAQIGGSYPAGTGPRWVFQGGYNSGVYAHYNLLYRSVNTVSNGNRLGVSITPLPGSNRSWFAFGYAIAKYCFADITGTDEPVVLSSTPRTFQLTNFHTTAPGSPAAAMYAGASGPPCSTMAQVKDYSGSLTLSADADGSIHMTFVLDLLTANRSLWERRQSDDTVIPNLLTVAQANTAATQKQKQAAAEAAFQERIRNSPLASHEQQNILAGAVDMDSTAWSFNHLDRFSVKNVRVLETLPQGGTRLYGEYTFNNGNKGWVEAEERGGIVRCLRFWDDQSDCRPVRKARNAETLATATHQPTTTGASKGEIVGDEFINRFGSLVDIATMPRPGESLHDRYVRLLRTQIGQLNKVGFHHGSDGEYLHDPVDVASVSNVRKVPVEGVSQDTPMLPTYYYTTKGNSTDGYTAYAADFKMTDQRTGSTVMLFDPENVAVALKATKPLQNRWQKEDDVTFYYFSFDFDSQVRWSCGPQKPCRGRTPQEVNAILHRWSCYELGPPLDTHCEDESAASHH